MILRKESRNMRLSIECKTLFVSVWDVVMKLTAVGKYYIILSPAAASMYLDSHRSKQKIKFEYSSLLRSLYRDILSFLF